MSLPVSRSKSDAARAEGNTAFKRGRWTESIGHYTTAILYNPADPLAYGNRAQAYLKLDKFADAERDCTSALTKQSGNIKALYRRALARKGLEAFEGARADLTELLRIEGKNDAAQEELKEVDTLMEQRAKSAPIKKPNQPASFSSLKTSRAGKKAHVPPSPPTATESKTPTPPADPLSTATGTGILLLRALSPLSPERAWSLLRQYPSENIPIILGAILEPDSLGNVLLALARGAKEDQKAVKIILEGLKATPRFSMNVMMLDKTAAEAGKVAWREAGGDGHWPL